jgi:acyl-CoA synthetase (AMP-forming)/AMP-acid ligase II
MPAPTRLQDLLATGRTRDAGKPAIRCAGTSVSYAELDRRVRQLAGGLVAHGVAPGDRVALFLPNGLPAVTLTLACYQAGAIAVPLNYRYLAAEARHVVERVEPRLLVYHASRREIVEQLPTNPVEARFVVDDPGEDAAAQPFDRLLAEEPLEAPVAVTEEDPALILFTSGSTGRPKGVVHSHHSAFSGIAISRRITEIDAHDVVLVGKPISHAGGLETQLMPTLLAGASTVLEMKPSPERAAGLIRELAVTQYALMASDLLDFIEYLESSGVRLPSLQNSVGSGDSVPVELHHRFRDLFGWEVMEGCGMTEIGCYYAMNPRRGRRKWGSLGVACPETRIRIVDSEARDVPTGTSGEILVQTPAATPGYWKDPEETATLFRDGWLHTGDLGRRDEDGYLWFVGRQKLMIVRRGSNIAPAEIENVIDDHPLVHASVVVGVPDARDGQVPIAFVARRESAEARALDENALAAYVGERLAAYKNPTRYVFEAALPRTGTGKFDRAALQRRALEQLAPPR